MLCAKLKIENYECQDLYRPTVAFHSHQCFHCGAGGNCAHDIASREISRHCSACNICVGFVSGGKCRNCTQKRGYAAGRSDKRCGRYDLYDLVGEQRRSKHNGFLRAGHQCRYGCGLCAEPRHSGAGAVASRGASTWRFYRKATAWTTANYSIGKSRWYLRREFS